MAKYQLSHVRKMVPGDLLPTTAALMLTYQQYGSAVYTRGQYLKDMVKKWMSKIHMQYHILSLRWIFTIAVRAGT